MASIGHGEGPLVTGPAFRGKVPRVLACVTCQSRKVKCNRQFPCTNCIKSGTTCVPVSVSSRPRRRRFPERELLNRLRTYESLLKANAIEFEPMHGHIDNASEFCKDVSGDKGADANESRSESRETSLPIKSETVFEAKNIWHAMNHDDKDAHNDEVDDYSEDDMEDDDDSIDLMSARDPTRKAAVRRAWDARFGNTQHSLFGVCTTNISLSSWHPEQLQIFRLWNIYLENVNPVLKVTHAPTLQTRIIEAASQKDAINPTLEALMFSIYNIALLSINNDECLNIFSQPKANLLNKYRFGCEEALRSCDFLRNCDHECLTALYLYLLSARPEMDPRSISAILGIAIRSAQRMQYHNESSNTRLSAFDAEMRRRLWWSMVIFDHRMCELSELKATVFAPIWDCKLPSGNNDSDLLREMKNLPPVQDNISEAIFTVVRSEIADFVRYSSPYLDFSNPAFKAIVRNVRPHMSSGVEELDKFEERIEQKYLSPCNLENPLHYMTLHWARGQLAKARLMLHFSDRTEVTVSQAIMSSLTILECDTRLMSAPQVKGFRWLSIFNFPFPAYVLLLRDLKQHPYQNLTDKMWDVMSDNYEARFAQSEPQDLPFVRIFAQSVLKTWAVREESSDISTPPRLVTGIRQKLAERESLQEKSTLDMNGTDMNMNMDTLFEFGTSNDPSMNTCFPPTTTSTSAFEHQNHDPLLYDMPLDFDMGQLDLKNIDWNSLT